MSENIIICPDIHGRIFWKDALAKYPEDDVIFLGDYVDPYPLEEISKEESIDVLKEIIDLAEREPSRITLLLGNHDITYLHPEHGKIGCRHDYKNEKEISDLLWRPDLFKLIETRERDGKTYIFSHSGIHFEWLSKYPKFGGSIKECHEHINKALWDINGDREDLMRPLLDISWIRGGELIYGSPVWADLRQYLDSDRYNEDKVYQIFGHTKLSEGKFYEDDNIACIDCKHAFRLTKDNKLEII